MKNIFTFKRSGEVMAIASLILMSSCGDDSEKKMIVCWGDSLTAPHNSKGVKQFVKDMVSSLHEFDGSHFTKDGYNVLAQLVSQRIKKLYINK